MAKEKKEGFFSQFKAFITKGNILDMAVGVIMGSAFGKIVSSLVSDIIMPAVGALVGSGSISDLKVVLTEASVDEAGVEIPEVAIKYGMFIQYIIDFLIVAFCMFMVIKVFMGMRTRLERLKKKEEEETPAAEEPKEPTVEEKTLDTLNEIKALLEKQSK